MVSFLKPSWLVGAGIGAGALSRPSVGRGIDEVERETLPVSGDPEESRDVSSSSLRLMDRPAGPSSYWDRASGVWGLAPMEENVDDPVSSQLLQEVEDSRKYHPDAQLISGSKTVRGSQTRLDASSRALHEVVFRNPTSVITCVRRYARRRVLLALGRGGKNRPPSYYPEVKCD